MALRCVLLAKKGQQSLLRFRIARAKALPPAAKPQKSIQDPAVQIVELNTFVFQPPAEIGDCHDLSSDRMARITQFGDRGCIGIEVFTQRPLAKALNRT